MDIKMNKLYLYLFQRLIVGDMSTLRKYEIQRLPGPLQTLPLELVEVNTQQID